MRARVVRGRVVRGRVARGAASGAVVVAVALLASACVVSGSWTVVDPGPLPAGDAEWIDVSCSTPTSCAAVGVEWGDPGESNAVVAAVFDGSAWTSVPFPAEEGQYGPWSISCGTPTSCVVVDDIGGTGVVRHWDGTAWSTPEGYASSAPQAACAPDGSCVAVDEFGGAAVWADGAWSFPPGELGDLDSELSCTSRDFCVGFEEDEPFVWDGATLVPMAVEPSPDGTFYGTSVDCTSPTACVAVGWLWDGTGFPWWGNGPLRAAAWDGTTWRHEAIPVSGQGALETVSCASSGECVALGFSYDDEASEAVTMTRAGSTWYRGEDAPLAGGESWLRQISCAAPGFCLAVGSDNVEDVGNVPLAATFTWDS